MWWKSLKKPILKISRRFWLHSVQLYFDPDLNPDTEPDTNPDLDSNPDISQSIPKFISVIIHSYSDSNSYFGSNLNFQPIQLQKNSHITPHPDSADAMELLNEYLKWQYKTFPLSSSSFKVGVCLFSVSEWMLLLLFLFKYQHRSKSSFKSWSWSQFKRSLFTFTWYYYYSIYII